MKILTIKRVLAACVLLASLGSAHAVETVNTADIKEWYAVAVGGLNLRDQPSQKGKKLALIPFGTKLEATGNESMDSQKGDYWTEVKHKGQIGWVSNRLLNTHDLPEKPAVDFDWRGKVFYNAPSNWKSGGGSLLGDDFSISYYRVKSTQFLLLEKLNRRVGNFAEWRIIDFLRIEDPNHNVGGGGGTCTAPNGADVKIDITQELAGRGQKDGYEIYRLSRAWVTDTTQGKFVEVPVKGVVCKVFIE